MLTTRPLLTLTALALALVSSTTAQTTTTPAPASTNSIAEASSAVSVLGQIIGALGSAADSTASATSTPSATTATSTTSTTASTTSTTTSTTSTTTSTTSTTTSTTTSSPAAPRTPLPISISIPVTSALAPHASSSPAAKLVFPADIDLTHPLLPNEQTTAATPAEDDDEDEHADLTNAQRIRRGLSLKAPASHANVHRKKNGRKGKKSGSKTKAKTAKRATASGQAYSGFVYVASQPDSQTGVAPRSADAGSDGEAFQPGYLSVRTNTFGEYTYTPSSNSAPASSSPLSLGPDLTPPPLRDALKVSFLRPSHADRNESTNGTFSMKARRAHGETPCLGAFEGWASGPSMGTAVKSVSGEGENAMESGGAVWYAYLGQTERTHPDDPLLSSSASPLSSAARAHKHSTTAETHTPSVASAIWTFDPATRRLIPHWVGADGEHLPTTLAYAPAAHAFLLTGDLAAFNKRFHAHAVPVAFYLH